jgi:hypothetical protein
VLRWIQETDSSHLLFDEVAHGFLRVVLYFPFTVWAPLAGTSVANRFDLSANRGKMAGTRRNRFLLSAVYDVPVGQNRKFLSHMNRISDLALGGWSVSTVSLWETGPYLTPTTSSSSDPDNLKLSFHGSLQRPDCIGNGNVANAATGSMFNIAAFNPIPEGPVGNCAVGILEGPAHSESPVIRPRSMPSGDYFLQVDICIESAQTHRARAGALPFALPIQP